VRNAGIAGEGAYGEGVGAGATGDGVFTTGATAGVGVMVGVGVAEGATGEGATAALGERAALKAAGVIAALSERLSGVAPPAGCCAARAATGCTRGKAPAIAVLKLPTKLAK
jgi:hypothetical protein